jgi:monovalent cation:proton antiporter-2 (CPA2) family protein
VNAQAIAMEMVAYLAAAVVAVPIAHRLGLGSILGYLMAGVLVGPYVLGWVGHFSFEVMNVSEFGVIMMLFLVGLELEPGKLWRMRGTILGLGGLQVIVTAFALALPAMLLGLHFPAALAAGLIFSLSSTAVVLPSLQERNLTQTAGGRAAFGVLLSQDIAVIPILTLLPFLAGSRFEAEAARLSAGLLPEPPPLSHTFLIIGAVLAMVLAGRFIVRPFFRIIATTHLQELFTAAALLIVIGIVLLMNRVGLDPALGAFLGGVVLADSEFRHQIEADIAPFKGLLLGIFFVAVGASINFSYFIAQPGLVAGIVAGLIVIKFAILWALARLFALDRSSSLLFAFALAQGDEFAFVLFPSSVLLGVLTVAWSNIFVLAVAISMALTPFLLMIDAKLVQPRFIRSKKMRQADVIPETTDVLLIGFGRFGNIVGRVLKANGIPTTILDFDGEQIDTLRELGLKAYYGDATRLEILRTAGAGRAKMILIMIDSEDSTLRIVDHAQKHFPQAKILARARDRSHAYRLLRKGVQHIFHEMQGSALMLAMQSLRELGYTADRTREIAAIFEQHEYRSIRDLAGFEGKEGYFRRAREQIEILERAVSALPAIPAPRTRDEEKRDENALQL